jgi:hypothetical protein
MIVKKNLFFIILSITCIILLLPSTSSLYPGLFLQHPILPSSPMSLADDSNAQGSSGAREGTTSSEQPPSEETAPPLTPPVAPAGKGKEAGVLQPQAQPQPQQCLPGQVREVSQHEGISSINCVWPVCQAGLVPQVSPKGDSFRCFQPQCKAGLVPQISEDGRSFKCVPQLTQQSPGGTSVKGPGAAATKTPTASIGPKAKVLTLHKKELPGDNFATNFPPLQPGQARLLISRIVIGGNAMPSAWTTIASGTSPQFELERRFGSGLTTSLGTCNSSECRFNMPPASAISPVALSSGPVPFLLTPGRFGVNDFGGSLYTRSAMGECAGTIVSGETKNCVIINNYKPAPFRASSLASLPGYIDRDLRERGIAQVTVRTMVFNDHGGRLLTSQIGEHVTTDPLGVASPGSFAAASELRTIDIAVGNGMRTTYLVTSCGGAATAASAAATADAAASEAGGGLPGGVARGIASLVAFSSPRMLCAPAPVPSITALLPSPLNYMIAYSTDCFGSVRAGEIRACDVYAADTLPQSAKLLVSFNIVGGGPQRDPSVYMIHLSSGIVGTSSSSTTPNDFSGSTTPKLVNLEPGRYAIRIDCDIHEINSGPLAGRDPCAYAAGASSIIPCCHGVRVGPYIGSLAGDCHFPGGNPPHRFIPGQYPVPFFGRAYTGGIVYPGQTSTCSITLTFDPICLQPSLPRFISYICEEQ